MRLPPGDGPVFRSFPGIIMFPHTQCIYVARGSREKILKDPHESCYKQNHLYHWFFAGDRTSLVTLILLTFEGQVLKIGFWTV